MTGWRGEGGRVTRLSFEAGQVAAIGEGWLQERYHSSDGDTVGDFLSFRSVYEINPFEVGTGHARERAECSARRGAVESLLEIAPLRRRPIMSLSNGEMRRVVLTRCLLKESGTVVVDGGCGGLDPEWRGRLRKVARAMRQFGVDLRVPDDEETARRGGVRHPFGLRVACPPRGPRHLRRHGLSLARRID